MWNIKEVEIARGPVIGRAGEQSTGLGEQAGTLHVPSGTCPASPSLSSLRGLGSLVLCSGRGRARLSIQEESGAQGR